VGEAHRASLRAGETVARLRSLNREERIREVRALPNPHPALAVCFCDESRRLLYRSPNEAEEWLRLAETALSKAAPTAGVLESREIVWAAARTQADRGNLLMFRGTIGLAHKELEASCSKLMAVGDEFQSAIIGRSLAFTWTKLGRPLKAKEVCLRSLEILTAYGSVRDRFSLLNNLALVLLALSEHRKARALFDHLCISLPPDHPYIYSIRRNSILPFLETKDYDEARRRLNKLSADLEITDLGVEKALTRVLKGEVLLLTADPSGAESEFRAALPVYIRSGLGYDEAETRVLLGKACADLGRFEEARGQLQMALAFYAGQGFALELVTTLEEWTATVERKDLADRAFHVVRLFDRFSFPPSPIPIM
jgi:tetratricopeptide (TPR) repeat protein